MGRFGTKIGSKSGQTCFSKNDCGTLPNQLFLAYVEPALSNFGPPKVSKNLDYGPFCNQNHGQKGFKMFSKSVPGPVGMLIQMFLAHFEPMVTHCVPRKVPRSLRKETSHLEREDPHGGSGKLESALPHPSPYI